MKKSTELAKHDATPPATSNGVARTDAPLVDVYENPDELLLVADMPGVVPDDLGDPRRQRRAHDRKPPDADRRGERLAPDLRGAGLQTILHDSARSRSRQDKGRVLEWSPVPAPSENAGGEAAADSGAHRLIASMDGAREARSSGRCLPLVFSDRHGPERAL